MRSSTVSIGRKVSAAAISVGARCPADCPRLVIPSAIGEADRQGEEPPMTMAQTIGRDEREAAVMKRVSNRFLWFLMLCFMINFIDRTNIGFAALTMNKDL